jgi:site-specific recombinase XerD
MPCVSEYVAIARRLLTWGTLQTYGAGLTLLDERLGPRELSTVRLSELVTLRDDVHSQSGTRLVERAKTAGRLLRSYDPRAHGAGAAANYVSAVRFVFDTAYKDGVIDRSPASDLHPPRHLANERRPLRSDELAQIWSVAVSTGMDTELDGHLLRFLRHTAARRGGCLNLVIGQLDPASGTVALTEKYGGTRTLPLHHSQCAQLLSFAQTRGATTPADTVFRYRTGTPMTRRRFNSLFDRIDRHLRFTEPLNISAHWIRHTTLADIAAVSDVRVAAAYAGHEPGSLGVIGRYTRVTDEDLRDAYYAVFGPETI